MPDNERHASSYRELCLFYTRFPTSKSRLVNALDLSNPKDKVIESLARAVDLWEEGFRFRSPWGDWDGRMALKDDKHPIMPVESPKPSFGTQEVPISVSAKLLAYTTALGFLDIHKLRTGEPELREGILRHARRPGWIGKSKALKSIFDLKSRLTSVMRDESELAHAIQNFDSSDSTTVDPTVSVANQIITLESQTGCLICVHNLAVIAFAVSVMLKGHLEVPENLPLLGASGQVQTFLSKVLQYRRPLQMAVGYTSLIAFSDKMLSRESLNLSALLLDAKRRGSSKPRIISKLENQTWQAIMNIATGEMTAYEGFRALMGYWRKRGTVDKLTEDDSAFFFGDTISLPRPGHLDHMFFTVLAEKPPPNLSLPPAALPHIHMVGDVRPKQYKELARPTKVRRKAAVTAPVASPPSSPIEEPTSSSSPAVPSRKRTAPAAIAVVQPRKSARLSTDSTVQTVDRSRVPLAAVAAPVAPRSSSVNHSHAAVRARLGAVTAPVASLPSSPIEHPTSSSSAPSRKRRTSASVAVVQPRRLSTQTAVLSQGESSRPRPRRKQPAKPSWDRSTPIDFPAFKEQDLEVLLPIGIEFMGTGLDTSISLEKDRIDLEEPLSEQYKDPLRITAWNANAEPREVELTFSTKEDYDCWAAIARAEQKSRVMEDGERKPLFACRDGNIMTRENTLRESAFYLLSHDDKLLKSPHLLQFRLRKRSIVVHGYSDFLLKWDSEGMETVGDTGEIVQIHDLSIPVDEDHTPRLRTGTLKDVLLAGRKPPRPLNAISLPKAKNYGLSLTPEATDMRALQRTRKLPGCSEAFPADELRFGLVATAGAHHPPHIDSRGLGTVVDIGIGQKLWAIIYPKDKRLSSSTTFWSHEKLDIRKIDFSQFYVEIMLLSAGNRLIMRSNTIHAVYTTENAICHGGHYLATTTLTDAIHGAVHSFFEGRIATNVDHPVFEQQMTSIAAYFYHHLVELNDRDDGGYMLNPYTRQGFEDLIRFACGIQILGIVSPSMYTETDDPVVIKMLQKAKVSPKDALEMYNISQAPYESRRQLIFARGRVIATLKHVFAQVDVDTPLEVLDPWRDLFIPSLAHLLYALQDYYDRSSRTSSTDNNPFPLPTKELFDRQVESVAEQWPELLEGLGNLKKARGPVDSMDFDFPDNVYVSEASVGTPPVPMTTKEMLQSGICYVDRSYHFHFEYFMGALPNL
ncbi:hypothetical protein DFP72DRAFT_1170144 [Ephemerocybe angulata]|uniref:Uncharacterized protein n=1 Tax=Ephemerocybe angulata TaxID=980116 RepID=A0A8H6HXZ8_9AGAR|nr:hypothetical protein DFP72DRAFT_1170144 [Tulosesus angulatus]